MPRVPDLNWPRQLYALPYDAVAAHTTAPLKQGKARTGDHLCACGCKQKHHMAVSGLEGEHGFRRVLWFATMRCKNRHLGISQ